MDERELLLKKVLKKPPKVRAILLCSATVVIYTSVYVSYSPLFSQYVRHRVSQEYSNVTSDNDNFCNRNNSDKDVKINIKIQQESADLLLYFSLAGSVIAIFVNLVLGSYSDFLGRKIIFALPTIGAAVKGCVFCLVVNFNLSLNWMYLSSVLEGLTGGFGTFLLAVFSYTADVTEPGKSRTIMIACMEGMLAVSGSLGQLGLGFLIQDVGYLYPAIGGTCIFAIGVVLIIAFLPETVTADVEKNWNPIPHIKKVFGFFFSRGETRSLYIITMLIFSTNIMVMFGRGYVEVLYQLDRPFCWSPVKIGYYGAINLSVSVGCSLIGLKLLQPCFRDMMIALFGIAFGVASLVVEGLAVNDWMLYLVPVIGFVAFNAVPVARSTMSKMTSPLEQGALFASIATIETICSLVSGILYTAVYQGTVAVLRGAVFFVMAGMLVPTALFIVVYLRLTKDGEPKYEIVIPPPKDTQQPSVKEDLSIQKDINAMLN